MARRHLDRLSALDASFLHHERPESHMHIGALAILDGPPPTLDQLLAQIDARLHLAPRYRQRLAHAPLDRGRPVWIDDPGFRLELHVRHVAVPAPGGAGQLSALLARTFSAPLDRTRALWELWFVEGLPDGAFALIFKTHHALIDGVAGVDLATVIFDHEAQPAEREVPGPAWAPARSPSPLGLMALAAARDAREGLALATHALAAAAHPRQAARSLRRAADGIGEVVRAAFDPPPDTPLNVPIGPSRRFAGEACALADFRTVTDAFGGTVNDVVLAVLSGALRRFLQARDVRTEGLELRALVPVSLRGGDGDDRDTGNRLAAMRATLPVHIADPLGRLQAVRAGMHAIKQSRQALGVEVLVKLLDFAPPMLLAQVSRLSSPTRPFNLLVSNVPGPPGPLYMLGREIREVYPVALLPCEHALAVAIISYNGQMNFGLLADSGALPELGQIAGWVSAELAELVRLARAAA